MMRPSEETRRNVQDLPDDDTAREFAELAELEELDPDAPVTERWRVADAREALRGAGASVDPLAELEAAGEWPLRLAEAECTEDRVARRLEGVEGSEARAPSRQEGEVPDDDIARELESM